MHYKMALNAENFDLMIKDSDGVNLTFAEVSLIAKLKTLALKTQDIFNNIA